MTIADQHIDDFLQTWSQEFTRAVEMFSGAVPVVSSVRSAAPEKATLESPGIVWWKQKFEGPDPFTTWIAAQKLTWAALAASENSEDEAQKLYLEMITQAQTGLATVASADLPQPIRCDEGSAEAPESLEGLVVFAIAIRFGDREVEPLLYFVERAAGRALQNLSPAREAKTSLRQNGREPVTASPMLDRLMKLELPLSVALGRAVMPIGDVLKITSGSMIELDRRAEDLVELIVHGTVVARGEVVSVKGNYGVRIKEIISKDDRMSLYDPT
jgi:flagellar motor switch protein FliN/FliY